MIQPHYDKQGTLIAPWGKLCEVCGGTASLFRPTPEKFINYIKCPGKPSEGIYCRYGLGLTLYQDPSTPFFEELYTGYRPRWINAGCSRDDYLKSKEHWANVKPFIIPERPTDQVKTPDKQEVHIPKKVEKKPMTAAGKLYWTIIDAIEAPFKAIGRQYNRWFGEQGSVRLWTEKTIGTEVRYKANPATYSADRVVTNKYITWLRTQSYVKVAGGLHSMDDTKWWTAQVRGKRNMYDITWRQGIGWNIQHWKLDKKGYCVARTPLIWKIREGKEKYWPAPVWETMH